MADKLLSEVTDQEIYEVARRAVEDALVDMRDSRIGILGRGNGLVIREADGSASDVIRLTTDGAIRLAIDALIAQDS